jgi:ubiquinone/menaquinone biosynthesis C-methylase UbiE
MTSDKAFAGGIPEIYDSVLVPLIFEPYAVDVARRIAQVDPTSVLEVAAGTGAVTRELVSQLGSDSEITATDLNQPMLDVAQRRIPARNVTWKQADAMQLPFTSDRFDVVVCQFGAMFFPDRVQAFSEARRVLRPGGSFVFSVWDRIEGNEFAFVVEEMVANIFTPDPPRFMSRTPHGYCDMSKIQQDLHDAGFEAAPKFETVTKISKASAARMAAIAYCQGTPLRNEIEARDASRLAEVTDAAERALARRFGSGAIEGKIQAIVINITKRMPLQI